MSAARYREIQDLRTERTKRSEFRSHAREPIRGFVPTPKRIEPEKDLGRYWIAWIVGYGLMCCASVWLGLKFINELVRELL